LGGLHLTVTTNTFSDSSNSIFDLFSGSEKDKTIKGHEHHISKLQDELTKSIKRETESTSLLRKFKSELDTAKNILDSIKTEKIELTKENYRNKSKIQNLSRRVEELNNVIERKNKKYEKYIPINEHKYFLKKIEKERFPWTFEYLLLAIIFVIISGFLSYKVRRISLLNKDDKKTLMNSLAEKSAQKEISNIKDDIITKAKRDLFEKAKRDAIHSNLRNKAIDDAIKEIKDEYKSTAVARKDELEKEVLTKLREDIYKSITRTEKKQIKTKVLSEVEDKYRSKITQNLEKNIDTDRLKAEAEKEVKNVHFIKIMDEVRNEYKKTIFDGLSDKELEDLKKEVYLETKQGFTKKSSAKSSKKNTSNTLDDFIDSL